jgi:cob(I)alamin adenosyltransferase
MSKIYTKTGDRGTTSLYGGQRVDKNNLRIVAVGAMDELNAWIGLLLAEHRAHDHLKEALTRSTPTHDDLIALLAGTQRHLFDIGAHLATPARAGRAVLTSLPQLDNQAITTLERSVDVMTAQLPELKQFILPGGTVLASQTHLARAVCRRAERALVALSAVEPIDPWLLQYCNRLSDWLFTLARFYNHQLNEPELPWK